MSHSHATALLFNPSRKLLFLPLTSLRIDSITLFKIVLSNINDVDLAASFAIFAAKQRGSHEVTLDHILLGCLRVISRFGIANVGPWSLDLESLGVDWVHQPEGVRPKVAYSVEAVDLFDRAARIAKSTGDAGVSVNHLLAALAAEDGGLMGELKKTYGITSASWRAAVGRLGSAEANGAKTSPGVSEKKAASEYLTTEQAAEALGIHVQTMRAYIRDGRLPAFRLAGERAIRILRGDLEKVLEPLYGESKEGEKKEE
jgi:excisionase family DNA binding protein